MRNTFTLAFYCRESRRDKKGQAPVELAVSINAQRSFINLPVKRAPAVFERELAAKKNNDLKVYLAHVEEMIRELQMKYTTNGKTLTTDDIRDYVKSGFSRNYTLDNLWEEFFASFRKKGTTPRNERKYELVMEAFFEHILPGSTQISALNHNHILKFERYLKATFSNSTAANMLSKLRSVILFGINAERIESDPFKGVKIVKKVKEVDFLSMTEVDKIRHKPMPNERLEHVGNGRVFSTGISEFCTFLY